MKIWTYFGVDGRVCADSDFKTEEETWRVMLGWPTRAEVREAKNLGDQVKQIDIPRATITGCNHDQHAWAESRSFRGTHSSHSWSVAHR